MELSPLVQRFLQSKGLSMEKAADLSQDAFVRLWNNCDKVTADKAKSYLLTVANNLMIDDYRKVKTSLKARDYLKDAPAVEDPEYKLQESEFRAKLEQAMDCMHDGCREVFVMSRMDGMKYREIADVLGIGVKAVEKRMSKAIKHLVDHEIIKPK